MIYQFAVGDRVVALRNGGRDKLNRPHQRPIKGRLYTITAIYEEFYGYGCTLAGLHAAPYQGYFLIRNGEPYFRKVVQDTEPASSADFLELIENLKRRQDNE